MGCGSVQFIRHERRHRFENRHVTLIFLQFPCGFQTDDTAADDDCLLSVLQELFRSGDIRQGTDRRNSLVVMSFKRRNEEVSTESIDTLIIFENLSVFHYDLLCGRIQGCDLLAEDQIDALFFIPFPFVNGEDFCFRTCKHIFASAIGLDRTGASSSSEIITMDPESIAFSDGFGRTESCLRPLPELDVTVLSVILISYFFHFNRNEVFRTDTAGRADGNGCVEYRAADSYILRDLFLQPASEALFSA